MPGLGLLEGEALLGAGAEVDQGLLHHADLRLDTRKLNNSIGMQFYQGQTKGMSKRGKLGLILFYHDDLIRQYWNVSWPGASFQGGKGKITKYVPS